jgi:hypothetical protein
MTSFQPVSDPFPGKGPIAAGLPGFYPRTELLAIIQASLQAGDSVSLVGERKAGKTSFLNYLLVNLSPEAFIPVYVDAQGIAPKNDRVFLGILARRAAKAIAQVVQLDIPSTQAASSDSHVQLLRLFELLDQRFNLSELQIFCFYLGVDFENLPGTAKPDKARELLQHVQRRERIPHLLQTGRQLRPDIPWDEIQFTAKSASAASPLQTQTLNVSASEAYLTFQEDLERLREALPVNTNGNKYRLVWLVDEIEVLRGYENTELFTFLRPLAQTDQHFRFVVAGYDVLYTLSTRSEWSPFYNAFRHVHLTGLNPIVAQALVEDALARTGMTLVHDLYPTIFEWTGQKPFFLKWLLSKVAEALNGRQQHTHIDPPILQAAQELFLHEQDLMAYFSHLWQIHTTPAQQTMLSWMAQQSGPFTYHGVLDGLQSSSSANAEVQSLPQLIENLTRLQQLGFLYEQLGQYSFTSGSLQAWIAANKPILPS